MDGLRWILLGIGILILLGIYYFGTRKTEQARVTSDEAPPESLPTLDDSMEQELDRLGELITRERQGHDGLQYAHPGADEAEPASADPVIDLPSDPEKIVTLLLKCKGNGQLHGKDIAAAADKVGLSFGESGIYHRMMDRGERQAAVFSMANITNPGTFNTANMAALFTPGLCLFMTLPNELSALDSWDAMHAAGQRLASLLEVELLDESNSSLSRQRIAHIRDEMRDYDRNHELHIPDGL